MTVALDLRGRTALVTGGSHGIGAGIAVRFAEAGASVVIHYRTDRAGAEATHAEIEGAGGRSRIAQADLTDPAQVTTLFETPLDILVNHAGTYPSTPALELTTADWNAVVAANLETVFTCSREAALHMRERGGGSIVNIASLSASRPALNQSHYNSSKAAVIALTRSLAVELAPHAITVNAVSPGLIGRPGIEDDWPDGVQRWLARAPLARLGRPLDVADACLFFASPLATWVTGQNLLVDGGMSATPAY